MKKFVATLAVLSTFGFLSATAFADTYSLTLEAAGPQNTDGVYVYPYNFNLMDTANGVTTTTNLNLMCLDFGREITVGENWAVTEMAVPSSTATQMDIDYRALAIIFGDISTTSNAQEISDDQFAAWAIFDPSAVMGESGYTSGNAAAIEAGALLEAAAPGGDYSADTLYIPDPDTDVENNGNPQRFIGGVAGPGVPHLVPTPEPSSLMLLGTGVIGAAGLFRRRFVRS